MGYLNGNVRICFCAIAAKRLTKLCERSTSQVPSFSQIAFLTGNWTPYELHGAAWIDTIHLSKSPTLAMTVSTLPTFPSLSSTHFRQYCTQYNLVLGPQISIHHPLILALVAIQTHLLVLSRYASRKLVTHSAWDPHTRI